MRAQNIQLQNADKSHCRYICQAEADRMKQRREVVLVSRAKERGTRTIYRLRPEPPPASESQATQCQITLRDMEMAVGAQRLSKDDEQRDFERLVGYGLIAENASVHRGYLRA